MSPVSLDDIYRDRVILDHCRNPRNRRTLEAPDFSCDAINPFCGDEIHIQIKLGDNGRIKEVGCQSEGCAINEAAGSLLSQSIHGLTMDEAGNLSSKFVTMMKKKSSDPVSNHGDEIIKMSELSALYQVREFPVRIKCVLLAWTALDKGLKG